MFKSILNDVWVKRKKNLIKRLPYDIFESNSDSGFWWIFILNLKEIGCLTHFFSVFCHSDSSMIR